MRPLRGRLEGGPAAGDRGSPRRMPEAGRPACSASCWCWSWPTVAGPASGRRRRSIRAVPGAPERPPPLAPSPTPLGPRPAWRRSPSRSARSRHVLLHDTDLAAGPVVCSLHRSPRLGRYQLLGEIARGGMGAVLKGRDPTSAATWPSRSCSEQHRDEPELVRRFVEEAQIGGQLQHPGIVPGLRAGHLRRPPALLHHEAGQGPHPGRRSWTSGRTRPTTCPGSSAIFEQVCQTVAYAHARGVIHRDLKPSNVMVGGFGEVQVMDWGLAKVLPRGRRRRRRSRRPASRSEASVIRTVRSGSDADASQAGSVLGTPAYMAPEQAGGDVERGGRAGRRLRPGLDPLRDPHRPARLHRPDPAEIYAQGSPRRPGRRAAPGSTRCGADAELVAAGPRLPGGRPRRPAARRRGRRRAADGLPGRRAGAAPRRRAGRVEAQARTVEEAKRRRLTVALAASLLGMTVLVYGGWAWAVRQRDARIAATGREVNAALAEATDLRGQARAMPIGDLTQWEQALAAARHAASLLARARGDAELHGRVRALLENLTRERSAAQSEGRRDGARQAHGRAAGRDPRGVQRPPQLSGTRGRLCRGVPGLRHRCRRARTPPRRGPHCRAADRRRAGGRLDQWIFNRRGTEPGLIVEREAVGIHPNQPGAAHLVAVAKVADPDSWRNQLRDALARNDVADLRELAASVDSERQPAAKRLESGPRPVRQRARPRRRSRCCEGCNAVIEAITGSTTTSRRPSLP